MHCAQPSHPRRGSWQGRLHIYVPQGIFSKDHIYHYTFKMNMNFTFLSENVHNTTIVDGSTNGVLVEVSTLFGPGRNTTTITNTDGDAIGVYERNWRSDKVTLRGHTMNLHEWMPKSGVYNRYVLIFRYPGGVVNIRMHPFDDCGLVSSAAVRTS